MDIDNLLARAATGDSEAQFQLGRAFVEGSSIQKDLPKGISWLERSTAGGNPEHDFFLGTVLCWESPPLGNFTRGFEHILRAAASGLPYAQYFVASELATGENVAKDLQAAASW
jgi:TPR repeat protein